MGRLKRLFNFQKKVVDITQIHKSYEFTRVLIKDKALSDSEDGSRSACSQSTRQE